MLKFLSILLLLYGCSCKYYTQKAIDKGCLSITDSIRIDTFVKVTVHIDSFTVRDTLYIPLEVSIHQPDSTKDKDTLNISDNGITGTLFVDWKTRTAKLALKIPKVKELKTINKTVDSTTNIDKKEEKTNTITKKVKVIPWWIWLIMSLMGAAILGLIFKRKT